LALIWACSHPAAAQLVQLPAAPVVSPAGYKLLLDYEVGGGERYYMRALARPSWPGFSSGVTIGIGFDCGYNSEKVIRQDWRRLQTPQLDRLSATAGITGARAKPRAAALRDILIQWNLAEDVFQEVTITRFHQLTRRTFPGFDDLRPNGQAALLSLTFNRGSSMAGPRRAEMREIRALVPKADYAGIAKQIRKMKRYWPARADSDRDLTDRRESEARLVETP
jgi:GH24 family phage-related lysozyme (muramidase)